MTSINIYEFVSEKYINNFVPAYLYIKRHKITGALYFGKHNANSKVDIETYNGSGTLWLNHILKHGIEEVETLWYCLYDDPFEIFYFAYHFCIINNIGSGNTDIWKNQILETGHGGGSLRGFKRGPGGWDYINSNRDIIFKDIDYKKSFENVKNKNNGIHPVHSEESLKKQKLTMLRTYGVENISSLPEIKEIKRRKMQESKTTIDPNTGKSFYDIKIEKREQTNRERYDSPNPFSADCIKNKIKSDCLEKYGVEYHQSRPEIRAKISLGNKGKKRTAEMKARSSEIMKNRVSCKVVETGEIISISKEEYDNNPLKYVGVTAGLKKCLNLKTQEIELHYVRCAKEKSEELLILKNQTVIKRIKKN